MSLKTKIAAFTLSVCTIFSLAACQSDGGNTSSSEGSSSISSSSVSSSEPAADPKAVFTAASEKTSALSSSDVTVDMDIHMKAGEESIDLVTTNSIKLQKKSDTDYDMDMTTKMEAMGQSQELRMFYTDGYYYMDVSGQKIKYAMDVSALLETVQSTDTTTANLDSYKDFKMEDSSEGTVFTYTADAADMSELVNSLSTQLQGTVGADVKVDITSLEGKAVVNQEGYLIKNDLTMKLTIESGGQQIEADYDIRSAYNNPGKDVSITLPTDLDSYTEVDPSAVNGAA